MNQKDQKAENISKKDNFELNVNEMAINAIPLPWITFWTLYVWNGYKFIINIHKGEHFKLYIPEMADNAL